MDTPLETIAGTKGLLAHIYQQDDPSDPREESNLGLMVCFHHRYRLGDPTTLNSNSFSGFAALEEHLVQDEDAVVILPLFLYDHGGQAISTQSWLGRAPHAGWDSGQVGFIYVTRDALLREYGGKRVTLGMKERARKVLLSEVETYDQYLHGDVYGYSIVRKNTCPTCEHTEEESLDSCWGYYGIKNVREAAMSMLECLEKED
jgi:hypothetical protein